MTHQGTRNQFHAKLDLAMFNQENAQQQFNRDDKSTFPVLTISYFSKTHDDPILRIRWHAR